MVLATFRPRRPPEFLNTSNAINDLHTFYSRASTRLLNSSGKADSSSKITDGTGPLLSATGKQGMAKERPRRSMLLILLPPGTDTRQLSQLPTLGILPIVSTPTLGAAAVSDNLFFPVLIWTKFFWRGILKGMCFVFPSACYLR